MSESVCERGGRRGGKSASSRARTRVAFRPQRPRLGRHRRRLGPARGPRADRAACLTNFKEVLEFYKAPLPSRQGCPTRTRLRRAPPDAAARPAAADAAGGHQRGGAGHLGRRRLRRRPPHHPPRQSRGSDDRRRRVVAAARPPFHVVRARRLCRARPPL